MAKRDDFSAAVARVLGDRAAYRCSRPTCRTLTIRPHSDAMKATKTGRACHICAAAPGGPRYDRNQSPEQRASIDNGIWLCATCHDIVDKDEHAFEAVMLHKWKQEHTEWLHGVQGMPGLPQIVWSTRDGLTPPESAGVRLTPEHFRVYRQHDLVITNDGSQQILNLEARIQLPERGWPETPIRPPAGSHVDIRPDRMDLATSGGHVEAFGDLPPPRNWQLGVGCLPPRRPVSIRFVSQIDTPDDRNSSRLWSGNQLVYYIRGSFQYEARGAILDRTFLVPLMFDAGSRRLVSLPPTDDESPWTIILCSGYP